MFLYQQHSYGLCSDKIRWIKHIKDILENKMMNEVSPQDIYELLALMDKSIPESRKKINEINSQLQKIELEKKSVLYLLERCNYG